ncbi:MAG TPA: SLC13 family permease [Rhodanobacteraceae bacterium]|nr:SLC13 family permease [Rhodanobacteraceae bacterium]
MTADRMNANRVVRLCRRLRGEWLLLVLLLLTLALAGVDPQPLAAYRAWLDIPTVAALLALLTAAEGVRASGLVQRLARQWLRFVHGERALVLLLLGVAALTAMLLSNDISLFLLMPLALALTERIDLSRPRLVTLLALAVNAGSTLSPVGNPQNLLLWRHSGLSIPGFVAAMAPTALVLLALLVLAVCCLFPSRRLQQVNAPPQHTSWDGRLALGAPLLLLGVLLLLEAGLPMLAAGVAVSALGLLRWRVLLRVDWLLLLTIALMLVGLGHLAEWPWFRAGLAILDWRESATAYWGAMALSQLISNVPATVALLHTGAEPRVLAMAVNVAGSGLAIGSLANLIALRLGGERGAWRCFHAISLPYFALAAVLVWWLLPA